jgi:hypothetical protein
MSIRRLGRGRPGPWRQAGWAAAVVAGALALAWAAAGPGAAAREGQAGAPAGALPEDLARVPADSVALGSLRLADLLAGDFAKPVLANKEMGKEVEGALKEAEKNLGVPLAEVERITAVLPAVAQGAQPLVFVGTTKAYDKKKVLAALGGKEEKHKGHSYFVKDNRLGVHLIGERAFVFGAPTDIQHLLDKPAGAKADGPMTPALKLAAGKHLAVTAVYPTPIADLVGDQLPPEAEPFKPLLKARLATATFDLGDEARAVLRVSFPDEASAKAGVKSVQVGQQLIKQLLGQGIEQLDKLAGSKNIVDMLKQVDRAVTTAAVKQDGTAVTAAASFKIDLATVGVTLMDSVQRVRSAAARMQSANNLKQIAIAMHNFHDTYEAFPPHAIYGKDGKPLLSWRVQILPFIEQDNLYKQFHLDEPWDSEHNKKLLDKMPRVYAVPVDEKALKAHETHYLGFFGKGAFFNGKKGIRITDITDGTSNTIMVVEADKSVPWTKPEDLPFEAGKPLPKVGAFWPNGFQVAICDGSVRMLRKDIKPETLRALITINGGEVIGDDF